MSSYGLDVLSEEECHALLESGQVGRIAVSNGRPAIFPVVYALLDGNVVFRTAPGEKLIAAALGRTVVFEVDDFSVALRSGWSVNVIGTAHEVVNHAERERVERLGLEPWAGEVRDRFVRITTEAVSGRRIHHS
jgi:nitroimidazol reductase NimA-like FMN-containing flavoprotein (pyridoxamine 5'-phosphate oxidase superfamily)